MVSLYVRTSKDGKQRYCSDKSFDQRGLDPLTSPLRVRTVRERVVGYSE